MKTLWSVQQVIPLILLLDSILGSAIPGKNSDNHVDLAHLPPIKGRRRCVYEGDVAKENIGESMAMTGELSALQGDDMYVDDAPAVTEVCGKDSQYCYALWKFVNGSKHFMKQGCWEASSTTSCLSSSCRTNVSKTVSSTTASPSVGSQDGTTMPTSSEKKEVPPQPQSQQHYFCCCNSDICNLDVDIVYVDAIDDSDDDHLMGFDGSDGTARRSLPVILIFCGSVMLGLLIIFSGYRYWKRLSLQYDKNRSNNVDMDGDDCLSTGTNEGKLLLGDDQGGDDRNIMDGIQLVVLLARGKFASVYEGKIPSLSDSPYALKCFTRDQKEFFENERFVFNFLGKHCNHENIIKYYGWQEFTVGPTTHLILVLDKICPGNLREYLQAVAGNDSGGENENVLKIADVLRICSGIASGMSYLHGENRDEIVIAHRDLTSKNVLLDAETLTPKITDYGLSLVTRGSKYYWAGRERQAEFCSLAEAGTLRYMAPELLEGAVNLKDCENALKQADVYALALIIWEVANCSKDVRLTKVPVGNSNNANTSGAPTESNEETGNSSNNGIVDVQHNLPYEEEIGKDNLSMELLTRHVVQHRNRPTFRRWRDTPYTRQLRDTLIESWDAEPDARLTALCIVERLIDIRNIRIKNSDLTGTGGGQQVLIQTPLESPGQGLFGIDQAVIDSPWTGRNPCLQRNLLTVTASSTGGGGIGGMSTSGSGGGMSESNSSEHHHLLLNFDYKNQANLNFYHNYVGGSSGGASYSSTSTTSAGGGVGGNITEMSNVSSINDDHHQIIETRFNGGVSTPSSNVQGGSNVSGPPPLPPTIPFVQNLHA